jgi:hypothetical protein
MTQVGSDEEGVLPKFTHRSKRENLAAIEIDIMPARIENHLTA